MQNLLFSFQGRINRAKFWVIHICVSVVVSVLFGGLAGGAAMTTNDPEQMLATIGPVTGLVLFVVWIAAAWISLAVGVRRFHDRDKSGWWLLIVFVPLIGGLWYLIECGFLRGTVGPNSYGPDPLATL